MKLDKPITIVIPGRPIVKKDTKKFAMFYKDKRGKIIQRDKPVVYYSEAYKKWAQLAIVRCINTKQQLLNEGYELPYEGTCILKCIFYYDKDILVDLSALYEGIQDVLTGHAGALSVDPALYKIIYDDSNRFIIGHDGSRVAYDYVNPRTEVNIIPVNALEERG